MVVTLPVELCGWDEPKKVDINVDHQPGVEQLIVQLTNMVRLEHGYQPLQVDTELTTVARNHNNDMIRRNYTAHITPEGISPEDRLSNAYRTFLGLATENIWLLSGTWNGLSYIDPIPPLELANRVLEEWLASPAHRKNLLSRNLSHMGVGVSITNGKLLVTQVLVHKAGELEEPLPVTFETGEIFKPRLKSFDNDKAGYRFALEYYDSENGRWIRKPQIFNRYVKIPEQAGLYRFLYLESRDEEYKIYKGPAFLVKKNIKDKKSASEGFLTSFIRH